MGVSFYFEKVQPNASWAHDDDSMPMSGSQKFGIRENVVAFLVGTHSLILWYKLLGALFQKIEILIFCSQR